MRGGGAGRGSETPWRWRSSVLASDRIARSTISAPAPSREECKRKGWHPAAGLWGRRTTRVRNCLQICRGRPSPRVLRIPEWETKSSSRCGPGLVCASGCLGCGWTPSRIRSHLGWPECWPSPLALDRACSRFAGATARARTYRPGAGTAAPRVDLQSCKNPGGSTHGRERATSPPGREKWPIEGLRAGEFPAILHSPQIAMPARVWLVSTVPMRA